MERDGHLRRVSRTISLRYITALCGQGTQRITLRGGGRLRYSGSRAKSIRMRAARTASALGWPGKASSYAQSSPACAARPIAPELVNDAPCQEVVITGDDVNLTMLPIPFMHEKDGGPYISAGVWICQRRPARPECRVLSADVPYPSGNGHRPFHCLRPAGAITARRMGEMHRFRLRLRLACMFSSTWPPLTRHLPG